MCQEKAEDHHTHKFCITCKNISNRDLYPFKDECACKGKRPLEEDTQSICTQSTQFILDEPNPQPLRNMRQAHRIRDYNRVYIPRQQIEPFSEPHQMTKNDTKLHATPWWLTSLETPTPYHLDEFNNYSNHYLCNAVWWRTSKQQ